MILRKNFWKNDWGFIWLLALMLIIVATAQFSIVLWEELLLIRFSFFVFMVIAIASSVLSPVYKKIGYIVSLSLFLFSIVLVKDFSRTLLLIHSCILTIYMIFTLALLVIQIFRSGKITIQKIGGGVAVYLVIGHIWTLLYVTTFQLAPESFQHAGDLIKPGEVLRQLSYFSFVTLTTTGYGDIVAVGPFARVLVILEGVLGQMFPTIFIAKLVSLQMGQNKTD